ncbi:FAD-binding oxidoreductase [Apiospora sp. TS-2023a]
MSSNLGSMFGGTAAGMGVASACMQIQASLSNNTLMPYDVAFEAAAQANWASNARQTPVCIVQPSSAQDLQQVITILDQQDAPFAIRSGGHNPAPGFSNIDDGVLVDLAKLTGLHFDGDKSVAVVGTGNRWGDVYDYLDQFGVTVAGGRTANVGVGGFTLGYLYGLVCDNVVDYEIVLADGSIVHANADAHDDLYWALKGGASNFGVVTSFTFTTYPIGELWGGVKVYAWDDLSGLLSAMHEYQSAPNKDPYANTYLQGFPNNRKLGLILSMVYLKHDANAAAFEPFNKFTPLLDTTGFKSMGQLASSYPQPTVARVDWQVTSYKPSRPVTEKLGDLLQNAPALVSLPNIAAGSGAFGLQPISTSAIEQGRARGGNALGLAAVNQTWLHIDVGWGLAEDDETARGMPRSIIDELEHAARAEDAYLPYQFMNDASFEQDVIGHYGSANVERLREIEAKYDPNHRLKALLPGGFKIPQAEK